jgi:hypothetical protein
MNSHEVSVIPKENMRIRLYVVFVLVLICLLHLAGVFYAIVPVSDLVSSNPVFTFDYSLHYQQVHATMAFLDNGRWHGYDPYFMGGYLKVNLFNADSKLWALFTWLFSGYTGCALAFKLFIPISLLLIPLCGFAALRVMRFSMVASLGGAVYFLMVFWGAEPLILVEWGLLSFVFTAALCIPIGLSVINFRESNGWGWSTVIGIAAGVAFLAHILTPVILLPFGIVMIFQKTARKWRFWLFSGWALVIVISINLGWIVPFLTHLDQLTSSAHAFTLQNTDPLFIVKYFRELSRIWLLAVYGLGLIGFISKIRSRPSTAWSLGIIPLSFIGLASFGSFFDLTARLQPVRFLPVAHWTILPLAALGCRCCLGAASVKRRRRIAVLIGIALPLLALLVGLNVLSERNPSSAGLSTVFPEVLTNLERWILSETDETARILMEDSGTLSGHRYFGFYYPGLVPCRTGRQLIGGPWPYMFVKAHITDFHEGLLLGRPINDFESSEFKAVAKAYNIGWIICWSDQSRLFFNGQTSLLEPLEIHGDFHTYRVNREHSFIVNGEGNVTVDFDRISVEDLTLDSPGCILSYHFEPGLSVLPSGEIESCCIPGITRPFIRVMGAGNRFDVVYGK